MRHNFPRLDLSTIFLFSGVQAFPEQRAEINYRRRLGDTENEDVVIQDNNGMENFDGIDSITLPNYKSNKIALRNLPLQDEVSRAVPSPSFSKSKVRLSPERSERLIQMMYDTNSDIKVAWESMSSLERDINMNLRQTFCNIVSEVYMPLDVQDIQDVQNTLCMPLFSKNNYGL